MPKYIVVEGPEACGKDTILAKLHSYLQGYIQPMIEQYPEANISKDILLTREPGSPHTEYTQRIRELLLSNNDSDNGSNDTLSPLTEVMLLGADRLHHNINVIRPTLYADKEGGKRKFVLGNRSIHSTYAYQFFGYAARHQFALTREFKNLSSYKQDIYRYQLPYKDDIFNIMYMVTDRHLLLPHLTVYLRIDYETMVKRKGDSILDRIESKGEVYHRNVIEGYDCMFGMMSETERNSKGYPFTLDLPWIRNYIVIDAKQPIDVVFKDIITNPIFIECIDSEFGVLTNCGTGISFSGFIRNSAN